MYLLGKPVSCCMKTPRFCQTQPHWSSPWLGKRNHQGSANLGVKKSTKIKISRFVIADETSPGENTTKVHSVSSGTLNNSLCIKLSWCIFTAQLITPTTPPRRIFSPIPTKRRVNSLYLLFTTYIRILSTFVHSRQEESVGDAVYGPSTPKHQEHHLSQCIYPCHDRSTIHQPEGVSLSLSVSF